MQRIGLWVLSGATVACFWALFAAIAGPGHFSGHWPVVAITDPASLLWQHSPVTYYENMALNTGLYGLIGLAIEPLLRLRRLRH